MPKNLKAPPPITTCRRPCASPSTADRSDTHARQSLQPSLPPSLPNWGGWVAGWVMKEAINQSVVGRTCGEAEAALGVLEPAARLRLLLLRCLLLLPAAPPPAPLVVAVGLWRGEGPVLGESEAARHHAQAVVVAHGAGGWEGLAVHHGHVPRAPLPHQAVPAPVLAHSPARLQVPAPGTSPPALTHRYLRTRHQPTTSA